MHVSVSCRLFVRISLLGSVHHTFGTFIVLHITSLIWCLFRLCVYVSVYSMPTFERNLYSTLLMMFWAFYYLTTCRLCSSLDYSQTMIILLILFSFHESGIEVNNYKYMEKEKIGTMNPWCSLCNMQAYAIANTFDLWWQTWIMDYCVCVCENVKCSGSFHLTEPPTAMTRVWEEGMARIFCILLIRLLLSKYWKWNSDISTHMRHIWWWWKKNPFHFSFSVSTEPHRITSDITP